MAEQARAFVPSKHLQPSLILASKAGANPRIKVGFWPYHKYKTKVKGLVRRKPTSLFGPDRLLQPSLMFASEAGANPCTLVGSWL